VNTQGHVAAAAITSQISTALEEISSETPRKADLL